MKPVIVADAGPLIALAKLDQLGLLGQLFSEVHIPRAVLKESTRRGEFEETSRILTFAKTCAVANPDTENAMMQHLRNLLDEGEAQALALAKDLGCGVLMDEKRGRRVAFHHEIPVVGSLGVLLRAKQQGKIQELQGMVATLQDSGYRLSPRLVATVLTMAGEV